MAWSVVNSGTAGTSGAGSNTGQSVALGAVQFGDVLVALGGRSAGSNTLASDTVDDTLANPWSIVGSWYDAGSGQGGFMWKSVVTVPGSCTVSSHYTGTWGFDFLDVVAYRTSVGAGGQLDATSASAVTTAGAGSDNLTAPSVTTLVDGELIVGAAAIFNNVQPTAGTGFTVDRTSTSWPGGSIESQTQGSHGSITVTATGATSAIYGLGVVTFSPVPIPFRPHRMPLGA